MRAFEPGAAPEPRPYSGPCLYLGSAGGRCDQPAREDGFCERHSPAAAGSRVSLPQYARIVFAILTLLAMIWPLVARVWREVSGWLR